MEGLNRNYQATTEAEIKVRKHLDMSDIPTPLVRLNESAATAQMAADALGCEVGQIVKSLIFASEEGPIYIAVSGKNRVDVKKFKAQTGIKLLKADADYVKQQTGFSIGGVSPAAIPENFRKFTDEDLKNYDVIWAAGGSPHTVFSLDLSQLEKLCGSDFVKVC